MNMRCCAAVAALAFILGVPATWADEPRVVGVKKLPSGQSYGLWAAEWWQWAVGVPNGSNPLFDTTGAFCHVRQVGTTWFLAGSWSSDPVVRACTIPRKTNLFFPIINSAYGAFLNDPPATRTNKAMRQQARCTAPVTNLMVEVDGFPIANLERYYTGKGGSRSPLFNVQLPPGNILGVTEFDVPELVLSPTAEEGYYIYLKPLSAGEHTITIYAEGCFAGFSQDITYNLTVEN